MTLKDIKIVFFGTPEFAVESLESLLAAGADIRAVVTMPDKTGGRGNRIIESAVKKCAVAHGLPLLQPEKLSDPAFISQLDAIGADLYIVIAFRMLPRAIWMKPPMGTFNLHASLLPDYRGAAPINRAIMNGEKETGVTTFLLKHEIDTGDILMQERIAIGDDEDLGSLYDRLMKVGARLTVATVEALAAGTATQVPQAQLARGREPKAAPKIFHEDCRIDWSRSAADIHNQVRGLAPVPGTWCNFGCGDEDMTIIKVLKTKVVSADDTTAEAGTVIRSGKHVTVATGSGTIELLTVQPAGKRPMDAAAWFNGIRHRDDGALPKML